MRYPHKHWIIRLKSTKSFTKLFIVVSVCTRMRNKYIARVNLYEMSTYNSWWWSHAQFSTCMSLLRHGCQRHTFWNSQTDIQMYTLLDQMNWQICPDVNVFKIPVKTSCTGHRWRKAKDFFDFCSGKICLVVLFHGFCSFVLRHLCPVHKIIYKCPKSHHSHDPLHPYMTWIYREC